MLIGGFQDSHLFTTHAARFSVAPKKKAISATEFELHHCQEINILENGFGWKQAADQGFHLLHSLSELSLEFCSLSPRIDTAGAVSHIYIGC